MKTRKIIVPIDLEKPEKKISDFLYPKLSNEGAKFFQVSKEKEWRYGLVILKGGGITENDLFARIVDAKIKIESVDGLLNTLKAYLEKIKEFSIGNIVCIESSNNDAGFKLTKYANRPSVKRNSNLP
ncbi:hypothetical protein LVD17_03055 [Fulvivirga ulvae]|uniref:hypothetical protein n=1 Tax=Fulvivirga ulvae TaxID=2904245 RepID=UPI001F384DEA|nr:hypothetical protein [Fulvivirga ulvae]UII32810.1 hypothetical protein LVD17_03055 [Fulvivirga ulvae]